MLAKRLKELRFKKGLTQESFADILGVSQQTVASWENNKATPKIDALATMADYFEVTTDYLLGRETLNSVQLSDEQMVLLDDFEELDTVNKQKVFSYIRDLIRSQHFSQQVKSSTSKIFSRIRKVKAYG